MPSVLGIAPAEAHAMQAIRHSMHSRHFAPQNKEDSHGKEAVSRAVCRAT